MLHSEQDAPTALVFSKGRNFRKLSVLNLVGCNVPSTGQACPALLRDINVREALALINES